MKLTIEKLVYGGDGLARPEGGKAVFVPFVAPGEQVEATVIEEKPGFARARLELVLTASPDRVPPPCPYFLRCGGCHYQHLPYEKQLETKTNILRETLQRAAKFEATEIAVHPSPAWEYRNRTRMHVHHEPEFALGYYRMGSRHLLPVESCPISSPLINRAVAALWQAGRAGAFPRALKEVEFFANAEDSRLLLFLFVGAAAAPPKPEVAEGFVQQLDASLPELAGAVLFRQRGGKEEDAAEALAALGDDALAYTVAGRDYRVSAGAFFQTNRHLAPTMVEEVMRAAPGGGTALDLYAGVGLFAAPLAERYERVVAVESSPWAAEDLRINLPANARAMASTTEAYLAGAGARARRPDLVVADPPRAGLSPRVLQALVAMRSPHITYVSCDPATLARDARALVQAGYRVESTHLLDLFPQTFHIEALMHFVL